MNKKLVKYGKSLALIINKRMLDALSITEKTSLTISLEGNTIIIKPRDKKAKPKMTKQERETVTIGRTIMKELDPVFKKLSKT